MTDRAASRPTALETLGAARYISVATFRRDGREVWTPVWVVALGGHLYCYSAANAGKVKRVRANARARLRVCDLRGRASGAAFDAEAAVVSDAVLQRAVYRGLREKYGWQMWVADGLARVSGRYTKRDVLEFRIQGNVADTTL